MTIWKYTPELDISFQHCERPTYWQGEEVVCSKCQEVMPESVFTCEHCGDGLATETFKTEQVCPDCLEFLAENKKKKDYRLNAYANGFGVWHCQIFFTYPGLGNTGEADRVAANAMRAAKRLIRAEIADRMAGRVKRLSYKVVNNESQLVSGRLLSLTIAEK
jgi:hypothetical protein